MSDIQAVLPPECALLDLLEYTHTWIAPNQKNKVRYEQRMAAFVLRKGRPLVLQDLGPVELLRKHITAWREASQDGKENRQASDELCRLLWEPLANAVGDASLLLLSPDGVLATFPFAALPVNKDGECLLDRLAQGVAIVPAPQQLPLLLNKLLAPNNVPEPRSLLLVGDVDYTAGGPKGFRSVGAGDFLPPLPGTLETAHDLWDLFHACFRDGRTRSLRGAAATEAAFRGNAPSCRYIYLGTHGSFKPSDKKSAAATPQRLRLFDQMDNRRDRLGPIDDPALHAYLAFAGASVPRKPDAADKSSANNGLLTAAEVACLDLRKTELVMLGACQTAMGAESAGEGLLGLQRAFQVSGARAVVATLWEVDDEETRELIVRFFNYLWRGQGKMSKLQALRQAQLDMLHKQRAENPGEARSFNWAAFVLSGDWR